MVPNTDHSLPTNWQTHKEADMPEYPNLPASEFCKIAQAGMQNTLQQATDAIRNARAVYVVADKTRYFFKAQNARMSTQTPYSEWLSSVKGAREVYLAVDGQRYYFKTR